MEIKYLSKTSKVFLKINFPKRKPREALRGESRGFFAVMVSMHTQTLRQWKRREVQRTVRNANVLVCRRQQSSIVGSFLLAGKPAQCIWAGQCVRHSDHHNVSLLTASG
jgi:hypothetical protein